MTENTRGVDQWRLTLSTDPGDPTRSWGYALSWRSPGEDSWTTLAMTAAPATGIPTDAVIADALVVLQESFESRQPALPF